MNTIDTRDNDRKENLLIAFALIIGVGTIISLVRIYFRTLLGERVMNNMKNDVFTKFLNYDMAFFEEVNFLH